MIVGASFNYFSLYNEPSQAFVAYQYFLHVVPTTYIAPRSAPLRTNQYSVTHYTTKFDHGQGTPGIFFKFDLDPLHLTIHQRTTTFFQLLIRWVSPRYLQWSRSLTDRPSRCVGVIGGVFVCTGYAIRVTARAVEVVTGLDKSEGLVAANATGVKAGLRQKWGGNSIRPRNTAGRMVPQGTGWVLDGSGSPYGGYGNTPATSVFSPQSSYLNSASPGLAPPAPLPGTPSIGLGISPTPFGSAAAPPPPPPPRPPRSPGIGSPGVPTAAASYSPHSVASPRPLPGAPAYAHFPPTPNAANGGEFSPALSSPASLRGSRPSPRPHAD
jgi:hypothetical protein